MLKPGHHYTLRIKNVKMTPKGIIAECQVLGSRPLHDSDFPSPLKRIRRKPTSK